MTRAVVVPLKEDTYRKCKVAEAHTDLTGDELIRMLIDLSGIRMDDKIMTDPRVKDWIEKNVWTKISPKGRKS